MKSKSTTAALVAVSLLAGTAASEARMWSKDPLALAEDYVIIRDQRSADEFVALMWLSSALVPENTPNASAVKASLDKYIIIGVVHVHLTETLPPFEAEPIEVTDTTNHPMARLDDQTTPPDVAATLAGLQDLFAKSLGPLGKDVIWSAYVGSNTSPCQPGGFRVAFAGETYNYDTPLPGCP